MSASHRDEPNLLNVAIAYATRGLSVLPLYAPTPGGCTCGRPACASAGKHPKLSNGVNGATTDPHRIRAWWGAEPTANFGIRTGGGLVVLDVDGEDGEESLRDLGPLPDTPVVLTPRGRHFYFCGEARSAVGFLSGLDLRGDGSYVVAPPSLGLSGRRYEWAFGHSLEDLPLAALPQAIVALLNRPSVAVGNANESDPIPEGHRNTTLTSYAGAMRRVGMNEQEIVSALLVVNQRCIPSLTDAEIRRIAASVVRYAIVADRTSVVARFGLLAFARWTFVPLGLLRVPGVDPAQLKVLLALLDHYREAEAWVSVSQGVLGKEIGRNAGTAGDHLRALRQRGFLAARPDPRFGTFRSPLHYNATPTLVLATLWAADGDADPERREALRHAAAERMARFIRDVSGGDWLWTVGTFLGEPAVLAERFLAAYAPPDVAFASAA